MGQINEYLVKKDYLGLKAGSIVTYNESKGCYVYSTIEAVVSEHGSIDKESRVEISPSIVESNTTIFEAIVEKSKIDAAATAEASTGGVSVDTTTGGSVDTVIKYVPIYVYDYPRYYSPWWSVEQPIFPSRYYYYF